jgi:hypothetical protein
MRALVGIMIAVALGVADAAGADLWEGLKALILALTV